MLTAFQLQTSQWVQSGRLVMSTAGGGYSSSFSGFETVAELTPIELFAFSEELFSIYTDQMAAAVIAGTPLTDDGASGSDAVITAMLADDRMQRVTQEMLDITGLRFYGFQGGTV